MKRAASLVRTMAGPREADRGLSPGRRAGGAGRKGGAVRHHDRLPPEAGEHGGVRLGAGHHQGARGDEARLEARDAFGERRNPALPERLLLEFRFDIVCRVDERQVGTGGEKRLGQRRQVAVFEDRSAGLGRKLCREARYGVVIQAEERGRDIVGRAPRRRAAARRRAPPRPEGAAA